MKRQIALFLLTIALLATACGSSSEAQPAVAASNASPTATSTTTDDDFAVVAPLDDEIAGFCEAVHGELPAVDDMTGLTDAQHEFFNRVAENVPSNAPNIVSYYFRNWSTSDELALLEQDDRRLLDAIVVLGSINPDDVVRYVTTTCPGTTFDLPTGGEGFPADLLEAPGAYDFCADLGAFETEYAELERSAGSNQISAGDTLQRVATGLPSDAPNDAVALVRSLWIFLDSIELLEDIETLGEYDESNLPPDPVVLAVTYALSLSSVNEGAASYFDVACPQVRDTRRWIAGSSGGTNGSSTTAAVASSHSPTDIRIVEDVDSLVEGTTTALADFVGELEFDGVNIAVGPVDWTVQKTGRAAEDPNVGYFTMVLQFDRAHEFDATSFEVHLLGAKATALYPADTVRSVIGPDRAVLQFPTDVGVEGLVGWRLGVRGQSGSQFISLWEQ